MTDATTFAPVRFHLADLLEAVVDAAGGRTAVVAGAARLTYAELDERANRLAHALAERGVGPGDRVALALRNGAEHLEAMAAAFKLRAAPVNVNYHYVEEELRPLFNDADPAVVLCEPDAVDLVARAIGAPRPLLSPGAAYEAALAAAKPARPDGSQRRGEDLYLIYTGGTTGRPKGVMWRHEDLFFAALGGGNRSGPPIDAPEAIVRHLGRRPTRTLPASPLVHGTAQWSAWSTLLAGGTVVLCADRAFSAERLLDLVQAEAVSHLVIVGDAFAVPLGLALDAEPDRWSTDSLTVIVNGGAPLSAGAAETLLRHAPGAVIVDGYGASETGGQGVEVITPGRRRSGPPRLRVGEHTAVLDESLRPLTPGGGPVGQLARRGHVPLGYRNDPEGSAATFPVIDGVRWAVPGDLARLEDDGTVTLLGRGSNLINSGGEKIHPLEVEEAVKTHPAVVDAVVVGVPDDRFGERVTAVVRLREGATLDLDELSRHCQRLLARFKIPRELVVAPEVRRLPSGKADYRWAAQAAQAARDRRGVDRGG
ncbi:MAG: AMP-binding protein [Acidimicrobiales bacterium]